MKYYRFSLVAILALVTALGLYSCSDDSVSSDNSTYEEAIWMAPEPDNAAGEITEASLEEPITLVEETDDYRFCDNPSVYGTAEFRDKRNFLPLARILRALDLTEDQKAQVKTFLVDFRQCTREAVVDLRASEKEILAPFNEQRRTVVAAWKNGEITREQALTQLKALNAQAREALKNNPQREIACEAMKLCRKTLLDKIGSVLTDEQLVKWNEWLAKIPEIKCGE